MRSLTPCSCFAFLLVASSCQSAESVVALCAATEPGERLEFHGRVFDMDGRPLRKAAIVAYQTDRTGLYAAPSAGTRVPRLRGVAVTDGEGRYRFRTVMPGPYPDREDPAHIHLTVSAPMHEIRYVTIWFEGDPRITARKRASLDAETVIVDLKGGRSFRHDVRLEGN